MDQIKVKISDNPIVKKTWFNEDGQFKLTKREGDMGYDIYTIEQDIVILGPGQLHSFHTGISLEPSKFHYFFKERGSTGIKRMSIRAGVMDNNYRGELVVLINNTSNKPIIIGPDAKLNELDRNCSDANDVTYYGTSKGICQMTLHSMIHLPTIITNHLEETDRGGGRLGSTNK